MEHEDIGHETVEEAEQVNTQNNDAQQEQNTPTVKLRRSSRESKTPAHLKDYHHGKLPKFNTHHIKSGKIVEYPLENYLNYDKLSRKHRAYTIKLSNLEEPKNYEEAVKHSHWRQAIAEEIKALEEIGRAHV